MKRIMMITLSLLLIAGCDQGEQKKTTQKQKITIAQFGHVFLYMPLYVAKDKGFFAQEGLNVTLVSTGGDEKTFAAVAGGSAQFGVADPTFTAIARERGQGGKVVASLVNGVPFWGITFRDDLKPIIEPRGFSGLKVATYTAPSTNYTVMKKILQNNGAPVNAQIVEGAFGSLIAMLKAGRADIAMELEPVTSIAISQGAHVVYSMVKAFGDFAFTGLTATDEYIESHPATVQAAVNALQKSMAFIYSDFEGTLAIAKQEFPDVKESILRNALTRLVDDHTIPQSAILSREAWDKAVALRKEAGDVKGDISYKTNVDMSFATRNTP